MTKKKQYQPQQDKRLTDAIRTELKKAQINGMTAAAKVYCKLFRDKINALPENATEADKDAVLADILHFCNVGLGEEKENKQ